MRREVPVIPLHLHIHAYFLVFQIHTTLCHPYCVLSQYTTAIDHNTRRTAMPSRMGLDRILRRPSTQKAAPKHFPSLSTGDSVIYTEPAWPRGWLPYLVLLAGFIMMMNSWYSSRSFPRQPSLPTSFHPLCSTSALSEPQQQYDPILNN